MSKEYDNTNRGTLGKNDRKDSDKHPDLTGSLNVEGKDYWLSGWIKESARGKFFSLAVKPKEEKHKASTKPLRDELDDQIPF